MQLNFQYLSRQICNMAVTAGLITTALVSNAQPVSHNYEKDLSDAELLSIFDGKESVWRYQDNGGLFSFGATGSNLLIINHSHYFKSESDLAERSDASNPKQDLGDEFRYYQNIQTLLAQSQKMKLSRLHFAWAGYTIFPRKYFVTRTRLGMLPPMADKDRIVAAGSPIGLVFEGSHLILAGGNFTACLCSTTRDLLYHRLRYAENSAKALRITYLVDAIYEGEGQNDWPSENQDLTLARRFELASWDPSLLLEKLNSIWYVPKLKGLCLSNQRSSASQRDQVLDRYQYRIHFKGKYAYTLGSGDLSLDIDFQYLSDLQP